MRNIKNLLFLFLLFNGIISDAQQLPFNTQFVANELLYNPAIAGTKRTYDIRLDYRNQWVGFPQAPVTETFSMNYSVQNKFGAGAYIYQDATGFTKRNNYTICAAAQLHFTDLTFSGGIAFSMINYSVDGSKITTNQTLDPAIDRAVQSSVWAPDASAGAYLYNDKWRFGLSAINLVATSENFYKTYGFPADTSHAGALQLLSHFYAYLGYIYGNNESLTWQNSLMVNVTGGAPLFLSYDLKCYIQQNFIAGISLRLNDAVAIEAGIISHNSLQICYSYDYITTQIGKFTSGSHEISIVYSFDKGSGFGSKAGVGSGGADGGSGSGSSTFKKRRYRYMF